MFYKFILIFLLLTISVHPADLATTLGITGSRTITSITAEADDDTLTKTSHGLVNGGYVTLSSITGGSGLTQGNSYYIVRLTDNTFKLSTSRANAFSGTAIDITSDGTSISIAKPAETITLGGDSITDANMYVHYLSAWFQLTYPNLNCPTYPIARSGSSVGGWGTAAPVPPNSTSAGLWERYHLPISPDIVFMMHGQNGGQTPSNHRISYEALWNNWINNTGAKMVMLGMHPVQAASDNKNANGKADEEASFAATLPSRLFASHTFDQMGSIWLSNSSNAIDVQQIGAQPFTTSGVVPNDSDALVHPGPAGHIIITWAVLKGLNVDTLVSSATLAANTNTVTSSSECTISNMSMTANGGTFSRLDNRLPWAVDEVGRANAIALVPAIQNWQEYTITITGLNTGNYYVKCDGVTIGTLTNVQLAAGWNMSDLASGPVWDQCQEVLGEFRDLSGFNRTTGDAISPNPTGSISRYLSSSLSYYQNGDQRGATYITSMNTVTNALATPMAEIFTDAQPITRNYQILSVSGTAPVVTITGPVSPPSITSGNSQTFTATATDAEDGNIAANIVWTSSIDNNIGTGATINPTLSIGSHIITATISDAQNNQSQATILATVLAVTGATATTITSDILRAP